MIIPADVAAQIRGGTSGVGSFASGAGSSSAGGNIGVTFNVTAMDSQSVANWLKQSGSTIAQVVANQIRNANAALNSAAAG